MGGAAEAPKESENEEMETRTEMLPPDIPAWDKAHLGWRVATAGTSLPNSPITLCGSVGQVWTAECWVIEVSAQIRFMPGSKVSNEGLPSQS